MRIKFGILVIFGLIITTTLLGQQTKMRNLKDLINKEDPGWPIVKDWIDEATNKVEILQKEDKRADTALYQSQVTTRSPMGAVIYETGGILIDNGWIRILGSGSERLDRSIMEWNKNKTYFNVGEKLPFLLVADDVLGGFFAINNGGIDNENIGKIYYYAPDCMSWEDTELGYSDFLIFCFQGDLKQFYEGFRWNNWKDEVSVLNGNQGINCLPFLWSEEGKDINKVSRKIVPIQELWDLYFNKMDK